MRETKRMIEIEIFRLSLVSIVIAKQFIYNCFEKKKEKKRVCMYVYYTPVIFGIIHFVIPFCLGPNENLHFLCNQYFKALFIYFVVLGVKSYSIDKSSNSINPSFSKYGYMICLKRVESLVYRKHLPCASGAQGAVMPYGIFFEINP